MGKVQQGVDAGFHLQHPLEWILADLVLPKSDDQAQLRNNAMSNRLVPQAYGASLFPVEPESCLSFEIEPWERRFKSTYHYYHCIIYLYNSRLSRFKMI